jgi:hypothetical protein
MPSNVGNGSTSSPDHPVWIKDFRTISPLHTQSWDCSQSMQPSASTSQDVGVSNVASNDIWDYFVKTEVVYSGRIRYAYCKLCRRMSASDCRIMD